MIRYECVNKNEISSTYLNLIGMSKVITKDRVYDCCKEGQQLVSTKQVEILVYCNHSSLKMADLWYYFHL